MADKQHALQVLADNYRSGVLNRALDILLPLVQSADFNPQKLRDLYLGARTTSTAGVLGATPMETLVTHLFGVAAKVGVQLPVVAGGRKAIQNLTRNGQLLPPDQILRQLREAASVNERSIDAKILAAKTVALESGRTEVFDLTLAVINHLYNNTN
jgi:hypothetical protein